MPELLSATPPRPRPLAIAYHDLRMLRLVTAESMNSVDVGHHLDALGALVADFEDAFRLLLDARSKTFTELEAQKKLSVGARRHLASAAIEKAALVSPWAQALSDLDGVACFEHLSDAWWHLTGNTLAWPQVSLVAGSTGAGKTTVADFLERDAGAVRFSTDRWMKTLFGPDIPPEHGFEWYWERIQRIEAMMQSTAARLIACGIPVVIDAGLTNRAHREAWVTWARELGSEHRIYFVDAPAGERWSRIEARNRDVGGDSVTVTRAMFDFVESRFEPPTADEGPLAVVRT